MSFIQTFGLISGAILIKWYSKRWQCRKAPGVLQDSGANPEVQGMMSGDFSKECGMQQSEMMSLCRL